jgi:hypothetical protein
MRVLTRDDRSPIATPTTNEPTKLTVNSNTMPNRNPWDEVVLSALEDDDDNDEGTRWRIS